MSNNELVYEQVNGTFSVLCHKRTQRNIVEMCSHSSETKICYAWDLWAQKYRKCSQLFLILTDLWARWSKTEMIPVFQMRSGSLRELGINSHRNDLNTIFFCCQLIALLFVLQLRNCACNILDVLTIYYKIIRCI